jgi:23S rRNA (pseudouridine1915-N3)-methyltransferase
MKVSFLQLGKTDQNYISEGQKKYADRVKHYVSFEIVTIKEIKKSKSQDKANYKKAEGLEILKHVSKDDYVILLDEKGKEYSSLSFAANINNKMIGGCKKLLFISGGAFGFSDDVYKRANEQISLSKLTFSHQLVRLIFLEQIYRAFTIIKGEPYHHE